MNAAQRPGPPYHYRAFGLGWHSDVPMTPFTPDALQPTESDVRVTRVVGPLPARELHPTHLHPSLFADGTRTTINPTLSLDTYGAHAVTLHTREDWPGLLPPALYGTIPAFLLAWRGCIPLHGSAVEIDGKAILVCGHSGAGKSTAAASLIAAGGRLLSDDLTVLHPQAPGQPPLVYTGRRGLRLFGGTARLMAESNALKAIPLVSDGKLAVFPPSVDTRQPVPLAAVVVLEADVQGSGESSSHAEERVALLGRQLFRPVAMRLLPGALERSVALADIAASIWVLQLPRVDVRDGQAFRDAGLRILQYIGIGSRR